MAYNAEVGHLPGDRQRDTRKNHSGIYICRLLVGAWTNVNCPVFACDLGAEGQRRNGLLMIPQTDVLARNKILGRSVSFFRN